MNDLTPGAIDLTPGANDLTPGANDLTPGANDLTPGVNDLTPGVNDFTPAPLDLSRGDILRARRVDFDAPSSQRALLELQSDELRGKLMRYAAWLAKPQDAEDILTDAILCVCDPKEGRPWVPERGSFSQHMRFVIHDIVRDMRDTARARREVPLEAADVERIRDPATSPDEALANARQIERERRLGARLREGLADGDLAARVFDDAAAGNPPVPAEIAHRLGCDVRDVYAAIRRLKRAGERVLAEAKRAEEAQMMKLREARRAKEHAR